jgi:urease accessory protein
MDTGDYPNAAMLGVPAVLGNTADGGWPARLRGARIDILALTAAEAQRTRLRKRAASGTDVAIALERGVQLRDGDVLGWDEASQTAVVVRVDLPDVMVVDLGALVAESVQTLLSRCVEVGHALGSQHWPALVKASQVYVPLTVPQEAMEAVMETHRIEGVSWWFARGAEVMPYLAPHEARLLFASATAEHSHISARLGAEDTR